jgi:hypothetical protein
MTRRSVPVLGSKPDLEAKGRMNIFLYSLTGHFV